MPRWYKRAVESNMPGYGSHEFAQEAFNKIAKQNSRGKRKIIPVGISQFATSAIRNVSKPTEIQRVETLKRVHQRLDEQRSRGRTNRWKSKVSGHRTGYEATFSRVGKVNRVSQPGDTNQPSKRRLDTDRVFPFTDRWPQLETRSDSHLSRNSWNLLSSWATFQPTNPLLILLYTMEKHLIENIR